jgi:hypothetical protein
MAMTLVSTTTVGSGGAANIEFTNIAGTGKDLLVVVSGRLSTTNGNLDLTLNNSATGYSWRYLRGSGSAVVSASGSAQSVFYTEQALPGTGETANTFSNQMIYTPNYRGSTNKSSSVDTVRENNATTAVAALYATLWNNTAAITSIKLFLFGSDNFAQHSTFYLYGIKNS